jgi:hypothetical protein
VRQWRLAAAWHRLESTASTAATATVHGRMHDSGSVRVSRRRYVRQRWLAAARPGAARRKPESVAATAHATLATATIDGRLHDAGSVRSSRRRHVRQRWMAAAGFGAARRKSGSTTAITSTTVVGRVHDAGSICRLRRRHLFQRRLAATWSEPADADIQGRLNRPR